MQHVTSALTANGYQIRFIIDGSKPKRSPQQSSAATPDAMNNLYILPYIKGTTEPIKRILSNYDIKVALKPYQTIGSLFPKLKDPIPKDCLRFGHSISWESSKILPASVHRKIECVK